MGPVLDYSTGAGGGRSAEYAAPFDPPCSGRHSHPPGASYRSPYSRTRRRLLMALASMGAVVASTGAGGGPLSVVAPISAHAAGPTDDALGLQPGGLPAVPSAVERSGGTRTGELLKAAPGGAPLAGRLPVEPVITFAEPIRAALDQISDRLEPRWVDLTAESLRLIRTARAGELPEGAFAGMLVGSRGDESGGTAIFASTKADVYYLASVIVHEAWHYHQYLGDGPYYGRAAEQEAIGIQVDVLRALKPSHYALGYLEESRERVADGGPLPGNPLR